MVVVTHQSASTLDDCLTRIRHAQGVAEIRVVDNDSRDDTLAIVQRHALADRRLRFIANPDNPGFAVGCNQGARSCTAPWLSFVNPDLLVGARTLLELRDVAQGFDAALLGVELVDAAGVEDPAARRRDPRFTSMLLAPGRARQLGFVPRDHTAVQRVDAVSGALMFLPRALFDRLGGFDEGYRLHAEDLDLCRRARMLAATVAVANEIRVVHLRGVSSRARPLFVEWNKHRGLARYFAKFEASAQPIPLRVLVYSAIGLRFLGTAAKVLLGLRR